MSYLNHAQDPSRKATALTVTVAVHAAVAVVLVTGLSYTGFIKTRDRNPIVDIPLPPELPPPPKDEVVPDTPKTQDFVAPPQPIDLSPVTPVEPKVFDPIVVPDTPVIVRPTPNIVTPQPQPSFAPKRASPRNDSSRWVLTEDYPSKAIREGAEGVAGFRVVVGSDGKVDACEITKSSGNAELDAATCKHVTRRARFEPATDGSGRKVVGSYSSNVRWQLPD
jgi:protein TonB